MDAIPLEKQVYYPESDGEPMAETELHLREMVYVWEGLEDHFATARRQAEERIQALEEKLARLAPPPAE